MLHLAEKWFKKKRILMAICLIVLIVMVSRVYILSFAHNSTDSSCVATVNGEKINPREFNEQMKEFKAEVLQYFYNRYNASESKDFWSRSFNGEIPIEYIRKKSLDSCTKIKVQQILAKKYKVIDDIDYDVFIKRLESENARRKLAVEEGKVIYGPVEYTEQEYFSYTFSNMVINLKEKLVQDKEIKFNENELKKEYEQIKEKYFKLDDYIKFEKIVISVFDEGGNTNTAITDEAHKKMKQALQEISQGASFETVARKYNKDHSLQEQVMDAASARMDYNAYPELKDAVQKLTAGDISQVVEANGAIILINCIERKVGGYRSFNEVRENIKNMQIESSYKQLINKASVKAVVKVNESSYNTSTIE